MELPRGSRHGSAIKSFHGCWTCRLRRKKCDETHPVCDVCATLHITCHYEQDKPEWMDGGTRQDEMAERFKREIKENAHHRRVERVIHISGGRIPLAGASAEDSMVLPQQLPRDSSATIHRVRNLSSEMRNAGRERCPEAITVHPERGTDCTRNSSNDVQDGIAFGRSDTILLMFYLEHLLPFLFPFYRPSLLQGGRAWILEMMISSPVVRNATLCLSSYFFSLARGIANTDVVWDALLTQTRDAFGVLKQALQIIDGSDITAHLHGTIRTLASIIQVQRFEIAVLSFNNCQAHLNAALALFTQLLNSPGVIEPEGPSPRFNAVMSRLGASSLNLPTQYLQLPSAEQAAFSFSSALLILDDIIASTMLQEEPRLYEYHQGLLGSNDSTLPIIDLESAIGCQNWALQQIAKISVLDAWKQRCKRAANLDVIDLVHRATAIKYSLETHLTRIETNPLVLSKSSSNVFTVDYCQQSEMLATQSSLVTRVWGHAALIYLFVVVSGWQPASDEVRFHIRQIVELLTCQISPQALLRTMVWPFCVAGCLAEPPQEVHFRGMVEALQPQSVFGTVHKALDIMENVWRNRDGGDSATRDLAACFRSQGDLVLLV